MSKLQIWLGGLLVIQVALASILYLNSRSAGESETLELFTFSLSDVSKVVITDSEKSVTLTRNKDGWVIPSLNNSEAVAGDIEEALTSAQKLEGGWPVASTASSHPRFDVAEEKFKRKVELYDGDKEITTFYVGSSPGFRKVHMRLSDDDDIYVVNLSQTKFQADGNYWMDKRILQVKPQKVVGADYQLYPEGESWKISSLIDVESEEGAVINQEAVDALVKGIEEITVLSVSDGAPSDTATSFTLNVNDNFTYTFYADENNKYFLQRNDVDIMYDFAKYQYDKFNHSYATLFNVPKEPEVDPEYEAFH